MKLPALRIAAAFATGIGAASRWYASPKFWFAAAMLAIVAAVILIWRKRAVSAWVFALLGCRTTEAGLRRIEDFVSAVAPRVAVVSVDEGNQLGHPVEDVVERYARAGVRFLRTDRDGEVTALTHGRILKVHTFAESHPR